MADIHQPSLLTDFIVTLERSHDFDTVCIITALNTHTRRHMLNITTNSVYLDQPLPIFDSCDSDLHKTLILKLIL